jgi:hypothetical protein
MKTTRAMPTRITQPNEGISFDLIERRQISEQAMHLMHLPSDVQNAMLTAIAHSIRRLTEVRDYVPADAEEAVLTELYAARIAYEAVSHAMHRDPADYPATTRAR